MTVGSSATSPIYHSICSAPPITRAEARRSSAFATSRMLETMTVRAVDDDPGPLSALGRQLRSLPDVEESDSAGAQEMLTQLQGEIAHAARLSILGELTASIAHEIIQPLTAIGSNIEATQLWLERLPLNLEEVRELMARTATEVQRAADIIHRV